MRVEAVALRYLRDVREDLDAQLKKQARLLRQTFQPLYHRKKKEAEDMQPSPRWWAIERRVQCPLYLLRQSSRMQTGHRGLSSAVEARNDLTLQGCTKVVCPAAAVVQF